MQRLEITDGELTVKLDGSQGYALLYGKWSPGVARLNRGGVGYEKTTEQFGLVVSGATGVVVTEKISRLTELIDRAARFATGESVRAVNLIYQVAASGAVWTALVLGGNLMLPGNYDAVTQDKALVNVSLEVERRGQWLTPDGSNLLLNSSFESWTGTMLDDWFTDFNSIGADYKEEDDIVHLGNSSLLMIDVSQDDRVYQIVTGLRVGSTYKVGAWIYATEYSAKISAYDGTSPHLNRVEITTDHLNSWRYYEFYITAISTSMYVDIAGKGDSSTRATFYIDDISLQVIDESGEPGDVATATAVANGDVATLAFGTGVEKFPSPTKIYLTGWRYGTRHPRSFLIVANGTNKIINVNAGALIMGGQFSSVTDTAAFARENTVMRYTPVNTAAQSISFITYSVTFSQFKNVAIFANVRNNSATTSFTVWAQSFTPSGGNVKSQIITIPGNASPAPYWISLGNLPLGRLSTFLVYVQASAASGSLDIDEFVVVSMDDGLTSVISIDPAMSIFSGLSATVVANHGALSLLVPRVEIEYDNQIDGWSASGDIAVYTNAPTIEAILLATGGDTDANRWRQVASAAVIENNWTASRLPGRLIPE